MIYEELGKLAKMIDHTNLKPDSTLNDIKNLCEEAKENNFGAVCVNPSYVKSAKEYLKGSDVEICTVIGFPLGATTPEAKAFETEQAIKDGASEIDMVINIGAIKSGDFDLVKRDIEAVIGAAKNNLTKVILETCYLTDEEIIKACMIIKAAGADFVKTSTGFGSAGATENHISLMRNTVGKDLGIKASGGIRDYETANKMIKAGANRIGASSSVKIIEEYKDILSEN
jgi:deoxyribose-phosphate aldolase